MKWKVGIWYLDLAIPIPMPTTLISLYHWVTHHFKILGVFLGVFEALSSTLSEHLHHNAWFFSSSMQRTPLLVSVIRTEEIKMPLPVLVHAVSGISDHELGESCRMPTHQQGKNTMGKCLLSKRNLWLASLRDAIKIITLGAAWWRCWRHNLETNRAREKNDRRNQFPLCFRGACPFTTFRTWSSSWRRSCARVGDTFHPTGEDLVNPSMVWFHPSAAGGDSVAMVLAKGLSRGGRPHLLHLGMVWWYICWWGNQMIPDVGRSVE